MPLLRVTYGEPGLTITDHTWSLHSPHDIMVVPLMSSAVPTYILLSYDNSKRQLKTIVWYQT
jgi:hypothetical protein